jgi:hypothetical protein
VVITLEPAMPDPKAAFDETNTLRWKDLATLRFSWCRQSEENLRKFVQNLNLAGSGWGE